MAIVSLEQLIQFGVLDSEKFAELRSVCEHDIAETRLALNISEEAAVTRIGSEFGYEIEIGKVDSYYMALAIPRKALKADRVYLFERLQAVHTEKSDCLVAICVLMLDPQADIFQNRKQLRESIGPDSTKHLEGVLEELRDRLTRSLRKKVTGNEYPPSWRRQLRLAIDYQRSLRNALGGAVASQMPKWLDLVQNPIAKAALHPYLFDVTITKSLQLNASLAMQVAKQQFSITNAVRTATNTLACCDRLPNAMQQALDVQSSLTSALKVARLHPDISSIVRSLQPVFSTIDFSNIASALRHTPQNGLVSSVLDQLEAVSGQPWPSPLYSQNSTYDDGSIDDGATLSRIHALLAEFVQRQHKSESKGDRRFLITLVLAVLSLINNDKCCHSHEDDRRQVIILPSPGDTPSTATDIPSNSARGWCARCERELLGAECFRHKCNVPSPEASNNQSSITPHGC